MKRICSFTMIVLLMLSLFTSCAQPERPLTAAELLNLGEKYLLELNYEQALVQFLAVIEIEPMNPRGYTGAAEAYVGLGQVDEAIAVLREGLENLPGNQDMQTMLDGLVNPISSNEQSHDPTPSPTPDSEIGLLAARLIEIFRASGFETILNEMRSEEFNAMLSAMLSETDNEPIIYSRDDIGCGFYLIDGEIFAYIGGYDGLIRSGNGIWLNVNKSDNGYYVFMGNWSADMPNGVGESIRVIDESAIERQEGRSYSLTTVISGSFSNGLVNGSTNIKYHMEDGHIHNWNLTANNGMYEVVGSTEWSDAVVAFCTECEADLSWGSVSGVKGFTQG